jgi:hypothetical protein
MEAVFARKMPVGRVRCWSPRVPLGHHRSGFSHVWRTLGCCLTATGASLIDARPGRSPAGATCRGDRGRGGDAAAIQSADILSWWHFRVECLCDALPGKPDHPSRCACLRIETPSATGCASPAACLGNWHARGYCSRLVSARRKFAGDEPSSISAIKCAVWAGVHFLPPMRTMGPNPARQHSFRNEMGYGTSEPWGV